MRAREFAADLFRRAQGAGGTESESPAEKEPAVERKEEEVEQPSCTQRKEGERRTSSSRPCCLEQQASSPPTAASSPHTPPSPPSAEDAAPGEPGYVNYSRLHYQLKDWPLSRREQNLSGELPHCESEMCGGGRRDLEELSIKRPHVSVGAGYADDKVQLPFTVTDLMGRKLQLMDEPHSGQVWSTHALARTFHHRKR